MKKLFRLRICLIIIAIMFIGGCAGMQNPQEMSPKEKLIAAYGTYNSQYALYMYDTGYVLNADGKWEKVNSPDLSDAKKKVLRTKKEILIEMYPLLLLYDGMITGATPYSAETEARLFRLIDRLGSLVPE
jgi:hypothetical protein